MIQALEKSDWQLTPFTNSERGRRAFQIHTRNLQRFSLPINKTGTKVALFVAAAILGTYFRPFWAAMPFISYSAWKDSVDLSNIKRKLQNHFDDQERLFQVYEIMSDIRRQICTIAFSSRSEMTSLARTLTAKWDHFDTIIALFNQISSQEEQEALKRQKSQVLAALTPFRQMIKSEKKVCAAQKALINALKRFTDPPSGTLFLLAANTEKTISHREKKLLELK